MVEGDQYLLQCLVQNIAPIGRLRVTFYKVSATGEQTELDTQHKSKDNINTPQNGTFTLDFTPGRDDDGAQLLCSAMLDLGPEGPQPPPVMDSNRLNINVHCESFWFSVFTHLVQQLVRHQTSHDVDRCCFHFIFSHESTCFSSLVISH